MGRVSLLIRKRNVVFFPAYASQYPIDKRDDVFRGVDFALLHCLIDCRRLRDLVQEIDLIKSKSQNVQNGR